MWVWDEFGFFKETARTEMYTLCKHEALPITDTKGGVIFAEKVRKHVQKAKFMYKGKRIEVTVSCGVSERKRQASLETTIKYADDNLYKAKNGGRNQVVYK